MNNRISISISNWKHGLTFCLLLILYGHIAAQAPIADYAFDGHAGDASRYNNDGYLVGGVTPTEDRFGNPCAALYFDGSSGYVEVPNSPSLQSPRSQFSVTGWFKLDGPSRDGLSWLTLVCKGASLKETASMPQYRVQTMQANTQSTISINTEITEYDHGFMQHRFTEGQWQFYAFVYDGNFIRVYLDAVPIWQFPYRKRLIANNDPLHIGKDVPGSIEYFHGALDEIRIFDRALDQRDISSTFNTPSTYSAPTVETLKCPRDITVTTRPASCYAPVDFPVPDLADHCGNVIDIIQTAGLTPGSDFPVGTTTVEFSTTGSKANRQSCTFEVTVMDKTPPSISSKRDTAIFISRGTGGAYFSYRFPVARDDCGLRDVRQVGGIASGNVFPVGTTRNVFVATDLSGNSTETAFLVTVEERKETLLETASIDPVVPEAAVVIDTQTVTQTVTVYDTVKVVETVYIEPEPETEPETTTDAYLGDPGIGEVKFKHDLTFDACMVTIEMYDDRKEDHDTISVYYNGQVIVNRQMIHNKKNKQIIRLLVLDPSKKNELVVRAWNTGYVGPNTLRLNLYNGDLTGSRKKLKRAEPYQKKILHSRPGLSSGIKLRCNRNAR